MSWYGDLAGSFLGSGTGSTAKSGWGELAMGAGADYMNYKQHKKDRKDKLAMFDKTFGAEQDQIAFQNTEYLDKKKNEEEAWGQFQNPYANIV